MSAEPGGNGLEQNGLLFVRYQKALQQHKEQYEQRMQRYLQSVATAHDEGHKFFGSGLVDTFHRDTQMPTGYYAPNALHSFAGLPNFKGGHFTADQIIEEARQFLEAHPSKKLLMVDALGQGVVGHDIALAIEPGVEGTPLEKIRFHTIATTLHHSGITLSTVEEKNGDAVGGTASSELLETVRKRKQQGYSLRYSWFRPVLGLEEHDRNLYVLETLYRNLRELYKEHDEGGYIFIQSIMGGVDIDILREILAKYEGGGLFTVDPNEISTGMVIRKIGSVRELPTLEEILLHNPGVVKRLLRIADAAKVGQ